MFNELKKLVIYYTKQTNKQPKAFI